MKNLLTIHPEDEVPVKSVTIRRIPRYDTPILLYLIAHVAITLIILDKMLLL